MIGALIAGFEALRAVGTPPPSKIEQAAARLLAGEAPRDVADDLDLHGEDFREASLMAHAMKPKPKPARQRQIARRVF